MPIILLSKEKFQLYHLQFCSSFDITLHNMKNLHIENCNSMSVFFMKHDILKFSIPGH